MNLIAMIGTIDKIKKDQNNAKLILKIEKPFIDSKDPTDFFDKIEVNVNNHIYYQDLNNVDVGTLIGLKGRVKSENDCIKIVAEKIQIF